MRNNKRNTKRVNEGETTVPWFIARGPVEPEQAGPLLGDWQTFCTAALQGGKGAVEACSIADKLMLELLDRERVLQEGVPEPEADGSVQAEVVAQGEGANAAQS